MQLFFLLLLTGLFSFSCIQSPIKQSFSKADSLVIHFKNEQEAVVTKTIQTTETKAIKKIVKFIDGKTTEEFNCGFDGKMFFYNNGQRIQEVDFNMQDETCIHFVLLLNGKIIRTKMNPEAVDFFTALEKGLPFY